MTWRPDRRRFLQTAAVLSAPLVVPARVFGANERIALGVIGVGTQGSTLLSSFAKRATVAAIADVSLPRAEEKAKSCGAGTAVQDYRRLLDRKDIDAVVIAVPHHWHALCAIHAAQAGKDIYCEKPLAYTIEEGRRITEAVRKHGRVFQTGLQQRSGAKEYEGCMHVRNGTLGVISKVLAYDYASPMEPHFPGEPIPEGLDWDRWCGPVDPVPFNGLIWNNKSNPSWVSLRPFSGGAMTDWGAHGLDMAQWGLGMDEAGPEEVWVEGEPFTPRKSTPADPGGRQKGPTSPTVFMRYPTGAILEFSKGPQFGVTFVGERGTLTVQRGSWKASPEELVTGPVANPTVTLARSTDHHANWLDCIRDRGTPVAAAEVGHRTTTIGHLANIARWTSGLTGRVGERLKWDAKAERFTNSPEANTFLTRSSRRGYELPVVG
jgi:predicted dehydrogenase